MHIIAMKIFLYYDDDGARDGTWNHVMKNEAWRNLTLCSRR